MVQVSLPKKYAATDGRQDDIARLCRAMEAATVEPAPFEHAVIQDVLSPEFLAEILAVYPSDDTMDQVSDRVPGRHYDHRRLSQTLPDPGSPEMQEVPAAFQRLSGLLCSPDFIKSALTLLHNPIKDAINKYARVVRLPTMDIRVSIELILDRSGFALRPHTDGRFKLVTGLLYLAEPGDPEELGTRLYRPKDPNFRNDGSSSFTFDMFEEAKLVPYRRNQMVIFGRTDQSFHGVEATDNDVPRRLIQFSIMATREQLQIVQNLMNAVARMGKT